MTLDKSSRAAKPAATRTARHRRILQEWVQHPADTGSTDMPAPLVDWLAELLGIDIVRQWSLDRSYLELLTTAQLQELAAEWKLQQMPTAGEATLNFEFADSGGDADHFSADFSG